MENKASQLNVSSTELRSKFISERRSRIELEAEVKSLKSNIKTLKREATLAQKASSTDKVQILSLETKIRELEGELDDLKLEQAFYDSLKLELERANKDLSSKEYTIECMEKGIEATHEITNRK
jgi:predicted nuclease with TOPRIM domain